MSKTSESLVQCYLLNKSIIGHEPLSIFNFQTIKRYIIPALIATYLLFPIEGYTHHISVAKVDKLVCNFNEHTKFNRNDDACDQELTNHLNPDSDPPEDCTNGVDDDGDGDIDCYDADCGCTPEHTWGTSLTTCSTLSARADDLFPSGYDTDVSGFGVALTGFNLGTLNAAFAGILVDVEFQPGPDPLLTGDRVNAAGQAYGISGDVLMILTFSQPVGFRANSSVTWNAGEYTHFNAPDYIIDLNSNPEIKMLPGLGAENVSPNTANSNLQLYDYNATSITITVGRYGSTINAQQIRTVFYLPCPEDCTNSIDDDGDGDIDCDDSECELGNLDQIIRRPSDPPPTNVEITSGFNSTCNLVEIDLSILGCTGGVVDPTSSVSATLKDGAGVVLEPTITFPYGTNPAAFITGTFTDGGTLSFNRADYDTLSGSTTYGEDLILEIVIDDPNCCANVNQLIIPPVYVVAFDNHAMNSLNTAMDGSYTSAGSYPAALPPSWGVGSWSWIAPSHYNVGSCSCSGPPWDGCSRVKAPTGTTLAICEVTIDGVVTVISPPQPIVVAANGIILNPDVSAAVNASSQITNLLDSSLCSRASGVILNQVACDHLMGQYNFFFTSKIFQSFKVCDGSGTHIATANLVDTGGVY